MKIKRFSVFLAAVLMLSMCTGVFASAEREVGYVKDGVFIWEADELGARLEILEEFAEKVDIYLYDTDDSDDNFLGGLAIVHKESHQALEKKSNTNDKDSYLAGCIANVMMYKKWPYEKDDAPLNYILENHNGVDYVFMTSSDTQFSPETKDEYNKVLNYFTKGNEKEPDKIMPGIFSFIDYEKQEYIWSDSELGIKLVFPGEYSDKITISKVEADESIMGGIIIIHNASNEAIKDLIESDVDTSTYGTIARIFLYEKWPYTQENTPFPFILEKHDGVEYVFTTPTDVQTTDELLEEYKEIVSYLTEGNQTEPGKIMPNFFSVIERNGGSQVKPETSTDLDGHWCKSAMERWIKYGVISGYGEGIYKPDANITRAEMATLMVKLMGYTKTGNAVFSDVKDGAWYSEAIKRAVAAGAMSGYGQGKVGPDDYITRQDAVVMISRCLNVKNEFSLNPEFSDSKDIADYARDYVAAMQGDGLVSGYGSTGDFKPKANITRAEIMSVINKAITEYVTEAKTFNDKVFDNYVIVLAPNTVFENCTFKKDAIISDAAKDAVVIK